MSDAKTPSVRMEPGWLAHLSDEFSKPHMRELGDFLRERKKAGCQIYPPSKLIFNAFEKTPFDKVRVVVLGQDPYHNPGQAHGLCFSVPENVPAPPSLVNILKEVKSDVGVEVPPGASCLAPWAARGVFLLNSVLTVERNSPASHANKGWELFTDAVVSVLNSEREHLVFMLWGSYAIQKGRVIDPDRHLVLSAPHPSPLSAARGFFGCGHFSRANLYLEQHGQPPVDWSLHQ